MKPIPFKGQNVTFAEDQPQYEPLPAHRDEQGIVTTCWLLEPEERVELLETGKIYLRQMTFNSPPQPVLMTTINPLSENF